MFVQSHPGVPLIQHLKAVAQVCLQVAKTNNTDFSVSQHTKEIIIYTCGAFHDIAKATSYFQAYLENPNGSHSVLKNHALPSAVFVFFAVKQLLRKMVHLEEQESYFLAIVSFLAVKRHHGHLGDLRDEVNILNKSDELSKQYASIEPQFAQNLIDECLKCYDTSISWKDFLDWFSPSFIERDFAFEYLDFEADTLTEWSTGQRASAYYFSLWVFSTLLYADRSDVILSKSKSPLSTPSLQLIENYRNRCGFNRPVSKIDKQKSDAYHSVLQGLNDRFNPDNHFYSITLPTGFGKTVTSLAAALKLKSLARLSTGRIIIAIPFTSIIDQTFETYQQILQYPNNTQLLKHHHLAEPEYKEEEDSVRDANEKHFLIETWESAIVTTTLVQLLESFITNNKSKLLKFPSLSNSVIVLDEVQQCPHDLWQLIRCSFFTLAKELNCYFILMSATQPLIFEPEKEITELVMEKKKYFSQFNRTKLISRISQLISLADFIEHVARYILENPENNVLVILNTKRITLQCFRELRNQIDKSIHLRYLTTLITPFERTAIINEIKTQRRNKRFVVVSTQLIEAGIDISFDTVFRALAPVDSVIQATGRSNRYSESKTPGEVFLYKIDEQYDISCRLYGKELILKTERVLGAVDCIEEANYLDVTTKYYRELKDLADYGDRGLLTNLLQLNFEQAGKFSLINELATESVFVALNEDAKATWREFLDIWDATDGTPTNRRHKFNSIKSKFYQYVINVPIPNGQTTIGLPYEPIHGFYLWEYNNDSFGVYKHDWEDLSRNEGYVFNALSVISF